jgi:Spy/CpxP family protein refolding chaperone
MSIFNFNYLKNEGIKMSIKNVVLPVVFCAATLSSAVVFAAAPPAAQPAGDNAPAMHQRGNGNYMLTSMEGCQQYEQLSAEQKASVAKIMDDCKNKMMPMRKTIKDKTEALNTELTKDKIDAKQVDELTKAISDLRGQMFAEHVKANMAVKQATGFSPVVCMHKRGRTAGA